jgi:hypothetical protein
MIKSYSLRVMVVAGFFLFQTLAQAQEFPIAAGSDTTFSGGAVFGGADGLVAVCGDTSSPYSITAQLVGASGTTGYLIGSRISLGAYGVPPGAIPVFDGTKYFLLWRDLSSNLQGQFLSTAGALVGTAFTVASGVAMDQKHTPGVVVGDTIIFAAYVKNDGYLYTQRILKTGSLLGNEIQVTSSATRDFSVAFDGTNFLLAWVDDVYDKNISGQFVSLNGTLVGSSFLIDGGPGYSDNPTALSFDGTRYLLVYHDSPALSTAWTIVGEFITTSGSLGGGFTVCDTSTHPGLPTVAYDGAEYLLTWEQQSNNSMMGRFFSTSGTPLDTAFTIFGPLGGKTPIGGVGFGGSLYLAVATRTNASFTDGDVYGRFIQPVTTGVVESNTTIPEHFWLMQNYPNPFNPSTKIGYQLPVASHVALKIYDVLGRTVRTMVSERQNAGTHFVTFDATNLPSGVYFCTLDAGLYQDTKKLLLLK